MKLIAVFSHPFTEINIHREQKLHIKYRKQDSLNITSYCLHNHQDHGTR